jgi:peptidoglycan/xylan/chitin deacetylase (PgdA/CDA1 family)
MKKFLYILTACIATLMALKSKNQQSWIRINLLGYQPKSIKVAIWASKSNELPSSFDIIEKTSGKTVFTSKNIKRFGAYGPFSTSARLNFSDFKIPGTYLIKANGITSPDIIIDEDVYKGTADFALRYLQQQRCGYNPILKDSCHTHDGFVVYGAAGGLKDSTHFDAIGGWHDASDYLQYSTTTANATYHLLMAYRDFPKAFTDMKLANGLNGKNGIPDVVDEARWGLDWLLKMHPQPNIMFNQLADDRDHINMRLPKEDSQYGKGFERPLYFIDGKPQQRGKFMNDTKGTSSTAAKFASAFSLASSIYKTDKSYAKQLALKSQSAYRYAIKKKGVTQTASVKSPYIYAEDNWVDDMELALANATTNDKQMALDSAFFYALQEPVTPWLIADTAKHYQWYPFINLGHYELAKKSNGNRKRELVNYYKRGIENVWNRAKNNAFYRGIPFIWCSNNLTVAFAMQCMWYKQLSGDGTFSELEQANFDWIFGCNPWGTSMVYGLPSWADTPTDPHSAFTHLGKYPIDGGLVDGPVYTSIYKGLIGIQLTKPDDYAEFQSDLAVYHDDYGDYSTNEPTMDGTASLVYLLAAYDSRSNKEFSSVTKQMGAITRGNVNSKEMAIVFTGDEYADGGQQILAALNKEKLKASFFFTGNFYRNPAFESFIKSAKAKGHYLGAHSDQHLLYADWNKRDSLLVTEDQFQKDLAANYKAMAKFGIDKKNAPYFLPPYEWYNQTIANWTEDAGLKLINFTSGTRSNADYTYPELGKAYRSTSEIYNSILDYDGRQSLNGFIMLLHVGTDPRRKDKFYEKLPELLKYLKQSGYKPVTVEELLKN